ncbi:WD repeat-containing protein 46 [Ammospiza caudacuta]|uniref:WD repeat-containing protein 46 n=1 Tax=Ammospiza caudacuta TaxID=2857398 RepID=UPI00273A53C3|nr:WD repeat-containing protein 46 [Ammospiza caudacuta]
MVAMAGGVSGRTDPFPGPAPVPRARVKRFLRGSEEKTPRAVAPRLRWHLKNLGIRENSAAEKAARWEPLLPEEPGFLEVEPGEDSARISQREIADAVDIGSAAKHFELRLEQFGPYRLDYTRNGRFLLLGGLRGHVAALDWAQRRLLSEFNVMETVRDVSWLHCESLLAVAQRRWLHVYDSQGLEIHVVRSFQNLLHLQFLPYHFLLAATSSQGLLHFLDVSVGREVATLSTRSGRAAAMAQDPATALIHLGHANGTVSLWTPNVAEPAVRLLAHRGAVRAIAVHGSGRLMATAGLDRKIRIFDLRTFGVLQEWGVPTGASQLDFSQRRLLAAACGDLLQIYPKVDSGSPPVAPFLQHRVPSPARGLRFCPFQDVLGAGHGSGFSSLLVPGSGEPNLDALEQNPFRSRRQRQEWEVKALLEKIPAELLTPEPALLSRVDTAGLEQKHQERVQRLGFDPTSKPKFRPRRRHRGRAPELRRRQRQHEETRARIRQSLEQKEKNQEEPPKKKRKKEGKTPQKSGNKLGENLQKSANKKGENPPKKGKKLGEKLQKVGEKTPKNQEKGEGNAQKIEKKLGKKTPKIGQKNGEKTKIKRKRQKGGPGSKLGGKAPKLGGSPPNRGALERFRK